MKRCAIIRFLACMSLLLSVVALAGCAEESLDVPLQLSEDSGSVHLESNDTVSAEHYESDASRFEYSAPTNEPTKASAVESVWNALLNGTAQAMDETPIP